MGSPDAEKPDPRSPVECLVLVSDTSTEAERLIASLRVRGFKVRDVPLTLLAGRVEAQRPRLVICDGQVPRLFDAVSRMRAGAWGQSVEVLLLGLDPTFLEPLRSIVQDVESRVFARPIDVYSVLQRVEEVIGLAVPPVRHGSRSMASLPRVGANGMSISSRVPTPIPRRNRASGNNLVPSRRSDPISAAQAEFAEPSAPRQPSIAPPSEISGSEPLSHGVPVARMSEELEHLLQDADRRLAVEAMSMSPQPAQPLTSRMSPEQELDAILPPDVLAALDDPVEIDEEDETSHPLARQRDRTSARAPDHVTALASNPVYSRPSASASALDEETPPGRPLARARAMSGTGSDVSNEPFSGSVLTPVPPSVKTHHTHHTQANSTPVGHSSPGSSSAELFDAELGNTASLRHHESDSAVPGTSPELEALSARTPNHTGTGQVDSARDVSSTAPPHPPRVTSADMSSRHGPHDDLATVLRRERVDAKPPTTAAERSLSEAANGATPQGPLGKSAGLTHSGRVHELPSPATTNFERDTSPPRSAAGSQTDERASIDIPAALGPGDVVRAFSRCVRSRYSGALALEDDSGIRRVVLREGDFVMVASGIEGESLIAFLIQRGDLDADAARLVRKLPQFGRHAGAALIAHGYLRQDELWPVLRAHAEWLLGRAMLVSQGSAGLETELSPRLSAEPAVFGGATGAEILIEVVRRVIPPETALLALGGPRVRVARGASSRLLSECALASHESQIVERAAGLPIEELLTQVQSPDFASALYAMVELGVLETLAPNPEHAPGAPEPPVRDGLDDEAVRSRVALRRALVDEGDYFAVLGVRREATGYEVRHAYLALRREFEPSRLLSAGTADLREDVDLVLEVLDEAYEILRDASRRERYRRALEAPPRTE